MALGSARSLGGVRFFIASESPVFWLRVLRFGAVRIYGRLSTIALKVATSWASGAEWAAGLHQSFVEESAVGGSRIG